MKKQIRNNKANTPPTEMTEEDVKLAMESFAAFLQQITPEKQALYEKDEAAEMADMAEFYRNYKKQHKGK